MTTKCTGLMGRIFGHKWIRVTRYKRGLSYSNDWRDIEFRQECQRCGAVMGEKK